MNVLKMLEIILNRSMMPQIGGSNSLKNKKLDNFKVNYLTDLG